MPTLPPYTGGYFHCPKCGSRGARTVYMATGRCLHDDDHTVIHSPESNERLHRECLNCEWVTDEAIVNPET